MPKSKPAHSRRVTKLKESQRIELAKGISLASLVATGLGFLLGAADLIPHLRSFIDALLPSP